MDTNHFIVGMLYPFGKKMPLRYNAGQNTENSTIGNCDN